MSSQAYPIGGLVHKDGHRYVQQPWFIPKAHLEAYTKHLLWCDKPPRKKDEQNEALANAAMLCRANPAFLAHEYLRIRLGQSGLGPFNQWTPGQRLVYNCYIRQWTQGKPVRFNCLKSRRQGVSTILVLLNFWRTAFRQASNGLFAAHEEDAAKAQFAIYGLFLDDIITRGLCPNVDVKAGGKRNSDEIIFGEGFLSEVRHRTVAPGGGTKERAGKGRSQAIHSLQGTEVAYWDEPESFWTGVSQCVEDYPGTVITWETTANGGGWYKDNWDASSAGWELVYDEDAGRIRWVCINARASQHDMEPIFLSWLEEPKYSTAFDSPDELSWFSNNLTEDEHSLKKTFRATPEQLHWRRRLLHSNKFNGDLRKFRQEYPTTPQEAFQSSGRKVFDMAALMVAENRLRSGRLPGRRFRFWLEESGNAAFAPEDDQGIVTLFKAAEPGAHYSIGVDACYGKPNGDYYCAQVLRNDTLEQVAVLRVREAEQDEVAEAVAALGLYYNEAIIVIETDGPGLAVQRAMDRDPINYRSLYYCLIPDSSSGQSTKTLGWPQSAKRRRLIVSEMRQAISAIPRDEGFILNDLGTISECQDWVLKTTSSRTGKTKEAPSSAKGYDDRIIALGLALVGGVIENGVGPARVSHESNNPTNKAELDPRTHDLMVPMLQERWRRGDSHVSYHPQLGAFL